MRLESLEPQSKDQVPVVSEKTANVTESYRKVESWIRELKKDSPFQREQLGGRDILRSPEGEKFEVRRITDPSDPAVEKIHKFLVDTFSEEEADTLDTIQDAISRENQCYRVVEDQNGKIIALTNGEYLDLPQKRGQKGPKESALFMAYVITEPSYRQKKIGSELYQDFYQFGVDEAKKRGHRMKGVVGEAVDTVESFLNRMGRKRIYFQDSDGNIREVPYIQAPLDWDSKNGKPRTETIQEHLMVRLTDDRQEFKVEELLAMVQAIYEENYIFPEDYFKSPRAYQKCEDTVMGYLKDLEKTLKQARDGKVFLLDAEERGVKQKQLAGQGKKLVEIKRKEGAVAEKEGAPMVTYE